jgi:hypothetical protein
MDTGVYIGKLAAQHRGVFRVGRRALQPVQNQLLQSHDVFGKPVLAGGDRNQPALPHQSRDFS